MSSDPTDDDPTMRVFLGSAHAPAPPPLPSASKASERTPTVALEIPNALTATRLRPPSGPYAKIGAALFAAGVLVGVIGAVTVIRDQPAPTAPAVASAPTATQAPKVAAPAAPQVLPMEPVAARREAPNDDAETLAVTKPEELVAEAREPPVSGSLISGSNAPSCQKLLGKSLAERKDPKAADRETRLGQRELVRGNVPEAQAAFCKALFWDRSNVERRLNMARLYLVRRDWEKAAEFGQSALKLDPKSKRALSVVSDAWAGMQKIKEARAALLAAERKPKANAREVALIVRREMALAKRVERLGDHLLAERLYRRVLLLDPQHTGAMRGVAGCLLRVGDHKVAEAWARKAKGTLKG